MPKTKKLHIPIHQMEILNPVGLEIDRIVIGDVLPEDSHVRQAHRDEYYMFFLMESGTSTMMVDFDEIPLSSDMVGFILPGQVHHYAGTGEMVGWFLKVSTAVIDARFHAVFESKSRVQQTVLLADATSAANCLALLRHQFNLTEDFYSTTVIHHLLNAFMGMVVASFEVTAKGVSKKAGRPAEITSAFRQLLAENLTTHKSPADYAAKLNISPAYLNEALKLQTGFSSTYWIQQETILEAKRLLYHTDLTVKEIAHQTGFEDHAYFSRLFKNVVQQTPLAFRANYRESSNHHG